MISPALLAALMQAKGQMQAQPQGRPMPVRKPMGQPMNANSGVLESLFPDRMLNQAEDMRRGAYASYGSAVNAAPPAPSKAMGLGDAATLGIAGLIGKLLFRSTDDDLAQLGSGYMGAKQQQAAQTDEHNMRRYQGGQQAAQLQFQQQMNEAQNLEQRGNYARGRADQLADKKAQRRWEEDQARAKAKEERIKQDEMTKRAMIRDPKMVEYWKFQSKTPEGRAIMAQAVTGGDKDAIEAARQLTVQEKDIASRTNERNALLPGKVENQKLKNDWQKITNEFLPDTLKGKIALTAAQKSFLETKDKYYPQYLQLALQRLHISQALAMNTMGNTQFDNELKSWQAQTKPATDGLEAELQGQLKRQAKLVEEIGKMTAEGNTDGANEKAQEMSRVTSRIAQIKDRLTAIGESAPAWAPPAEGMTGNIPAPKQLTAAEERANAKSNAKPVRPGETKPVAATTTKKAPAKQEAPKKTDKSNPFSGLGGKIKG